MEGGSAPDKIMEGGAAAPELGENGETQISPSCEQAVNFLRDLKNVTEPDREDQNRYFTFEYNYADKPNMGKIQQIYNTKFNGTLLNARDIDYNDTESYLTELFQRNLNGEDSISIAAINPDDTIIAATSRFSIRNRTGDRVLLGVNCDPENTCTCTFSLEPTKEVIGPPPDIRAATKTG